MFREEGSQVQPQTQDLEVLLKRMAMVILSDPIQQRVIEQMARPLPLHLSEYRWCLEGRGNTRRHNEETVRRIRLMLRLCKATQFAQLSGSSIQMALGTLRAVRPRRKSLGPATANAYLNALKAFCAWMVKDGRSGRSPCLAVQPLNTRVDVRKVRRVLSQEEALRLIAAAQAGPPIARISGAERAITYTLACTTGLRSNEIQSLTAASFELDGPKPHVVVEAAFSKHRRRDVIPLRADIARRVRDYLAAVATVPGDGKLFRRPSCDNGMRALKADLAAAGIPYRTAAGDADFHSLRHTYISRLIEGGANVKEAQDLARHADPRLTLARYTHVEDGAKRAAVERLAPLGDDDDARAALDDARATVRRRRFQEDGVTWIAAGDVLADLDIRPEAAELLCQFDHKLPRPRVETYGDGSTEKFFPREPLAAWVQTLRTEAQALRTGPPRRRTREQLEQLPRDVWIGIDTARALGFTETYLRSHSRIDGDMGAATPDPALGKLFESDYRPRLWRRRHVVLERTWLAGELLDSSAKRGTSPDLPAGCILLRDAAKKFRLTHSGMLRRVASLGLPQRTCTRIKKTGAAQLTSYLTPEDLAAIDPPVEPDPRFVTVSAAADLAGVGSGKITWAANSGKVATNGKKYRQRRIDRASLEVWIEWRRQKLARRQRRDAERRRP